MNVVDEALMDHVRFAFNALMLAIVAMGVICNKKWGTMGFEATTLPYRFWDMPQDSTKN